ncbi:hypothetical protein VSS37_00870 [Candidatus Thiothrix sp. Deng01]|uniref:FecR N-terminal domain-containing protein n=1 Tax=Candidatus Thiothrix phosphatis TaxID=3112415 RepID=A0ABU6CTN8_9GAMM|nr:hypothetical protein [Candidatus Thiothrix sp. Deng01]MEB4589519.1 hypothetical protein [Candidatus Thiothrix sp. Deng01]
MSKPIDQRAAIPHGIEPDVWLEAFEERAAIMEHDSGLPRQQAEWQAWHICLAEFRSRRPTTTTGH